MNGILMPLSLSENFSCSESKMNIKMPAEADDIESSNGTFGNSIISNHETDIICEKTAESRIPETLSEDSDMYNSCDTFGKLLQNTEIPTTLNNNVDSDTSSAEYEIVSLNVENTTKTTVINTTYNLITPSYLKGAEKKEFVQNLQSSPFKLCNSIDKSRVVVQVLTSNAENCVAHPIIDDKNNCGQSMSKHSFRDDVFKILSKSKPQNCSDKSNDSKGSKSNHGHNSNMYSLHDDAFNILSNNQPVKCNNDKDIHIKLNNHNQISNNCCFNDDVFKILSKTKTLTFNDENTSEKAINMEEDMMHSDEKSVVEASSKSEVSNEFQRSRREIQV